MRIRQAILFDQSSQNNEPRLPTFIFRNIEKNVSVMVIKYDGRSKYSNHKKSRHAKMKKSEASSDEQYYNLRSGYAQIW